MTQKYNEFSQFRLNLPKKIAYISDFENDWSIGSKKFWQKKIAKIIRVSWMLKSKIDFSKIHTNQTFIWLCQKS